MSESRDLAHHEPGSGGAVASRPVASTAIPMEQQMEMMRTALTDPNVDPAKAREMFTLMREMQQDARQAEFNRDLIAAKREIPPIYKRGLNTHQNTKYGKMEDIQRVVDPILDRHNLSIDYEIGSDANMITVTPVLRHANGWVEKGKPMKGPADTGPGRSAIQAVGSASSYLMRYAAKGALNLRFDGEDDDGAAGRLNDQPNDRQQQLIIDAQEAADRGEYAGFYQRLGTKDKSLLVKTGHHARLGGGKALPGPSEDRGTTARHKDDRAPYDPVEDERRESPEPEQRRDAPPTDTGNQPDSSTASPAKKKAQTPQEWVTRYCGDVDKIVNADRLDEYVDGKRDALIRLEQSHPDLHKKAVDHHRRRREAITEGRLV